MIRPYQSALFGSRRVNSINFESRRPLYVRRTDVARYYLDRASNVYADLASDLACRLIDETGGLPIRRLQSIFECLFVDELQDLSGYDYRLLEHLLGSGLHVFAVGDPRQCTYATTRHSKDRRFRESGLFQWAKSQEKAGRAAVRELCQSYRCNEAICQFADKLYPELPMTVSLQGECTGHDGVFLVRSEEVRDYWKCYRPEVLRWDRRAAGPRKASLPAVNIGVVKGCTFSRVLLFSTGKMLEFLRTGDPDRAGSRSKFYVAVTRARHSVGIVVNSAGIRCDFVRHWCQGY